MFNLPRDVGRLDDWHEHIWKDRSLWIPSVEFVDDWDQDSCRVAKQHNPRALSPQANDAAQGGAFDTISSIWGKGSSQLVGGWWFHIFDVVEPIACRHHPIVQA